MAEKNEHPAATGALSAANAEFSTDVSWAEKAFAVHKAEPSQRGRVWTALGWVECLQDIPELSGLSVDELQRMLCDDSEYLRIQNLAATSEDGFLRRLFEEAVPCAVSPWHRLDPIGESGWYKKPHVHVLFSFGGKKNATQVMRICRRVFGEHFGPGVQPVESVESAARYLCHLDVPDNVPVVKHKYPTEGPFGPVSFGGFDILPYFKMTEEQAKAASRELLDLAEDGGYDEIADFVDFVKHERPDLFPFLMKSATFSVVSAYVRSRHFIRKEHERTALGSAGDTKRVIYVWGESGSGKTIWSKDFGDRNGLGFFMSGASNDPLEGYDGSPLLILDELRPQVFYWSDLLKLLDPHNATLAAARYRNVDTSLISYVVITSVLSPEQFLDKVRGIDGEDRTQFYRRLSMVVHLSRDKVRYERSDGTTLRVEDNHLLDAFRGGDASDDSAFLRMVFGD